MRFNHFKKSAVGLVLGLSLVHIAQAQTAIPTATASFSGTFTANTCRLQAASANSGSVTGNATPLSVNLGTISIPANTTAALTPLGNPVSVTLQLRDAAGTGVCAAASAADKSLYNVLLDMTAEQITTIGTAKYRKNDAITGPTNAVLVVNQGVGNSVTAPNLNLLPRQGLTGTKVAGVGQTFGTGMQLTFQLATAAAGAPTPGAFSASIPLFVTYE